MADGNGVVQQSVLDRLMEETTRARHGSSWNVSVEDLKRSLVRDLEWLLNARRNDASSLDAYPEVRNSVFYFGLPDISSMSGDSQEVRTYLMQQVEECIQLFEPRLTGVRVSLADDGEGSHRQTRFIIEGLLRMDPEPERVLFDTVLEAGSGKFLVSGVA